MLTLADKLQLIRNDLISETARKFIEKLDKSHFFERTRVYISGIDFSSKVSLPEDIKINVDNLRNQYDTFSLTRDGMFQVHDTIEGRNKTFNSIDMEALIYFLCYIEQNLL